MTEERPEYLEDALEMLGKGYAGITIEPERTILERRKGDFKEVVVPAFVKISTAFKDELKDVDGTALKVFLFIALSVNRNTGTAHPALRTIAAAVGAGVNTVQDCLKQLEKSGLLMVDRESHRYNIYTPCDLVSANSKNVSHSDTDGKSVSGEDESVSENPKSVSASQILNQRNQSNQIKGVANKIFAGLPVTEGDLLRENEKTAATNAFEEAFAFGTLPWWSSVAWDKFGKFIVGVWREDHSAFIGYVKWREGEGKFNAMSNKQIRQNPTAFVDTGWPEYASSQKAKPNEPTYPKFVPPDESQAVPNPYPNRRPGSSHSGQ